MCYLLNTVPLGVRASAYELGQGGGHSSVHNNCYSKKSWRSRADLEEGQETEGQKASSTASMPTQSPVLPREEEDRPQPLCKHQPLHQHKSEQEPSHPPLWERASLGQPSMQNSPKPQGLPLLLQSPWLFPTSTRNLTWPGCGPARLLGCTPWRSVITSHAQAPSVPLWLPSAASAAVLGPEMEPISPRGIHRKLHTHWAAPPGVGPELYPSVTSASPTGDSQGQHWAAGGLFSKLSFQSGLPAWKVEVCKPPQWSLNRVHLNTYPAPMALSSIASK